MGHEIMRLYLYLMPVVQRPALSEGPKKVSPSEYFKMLNIVFTLLSLVIKWQTIIDFTE